MKEYVLMIDSGMGGLSILSHCLMGGRYNYIYLSLSNYLPLGDKTPNQLLNISKKYINKLRKIYDIKIVVLACNTLTTSVIDNLRAFYPELIFVGTEPCIKLVKDKGYKKVLVLATPATIKNSKVIAKYSTQEDILIGDKLLAKLIEDNRYNLYRLVPYIVEKCKDIDASCIVLGCTHYVFIKDIIQSVTSKPCFDSGEYVGKRVDYLGQKIELKGENELIFCDSGGQKEIFEYFTKKCLIYFARYVMI